MTGILNVVMTLPLTAFRGNKYNGDRSKPIPVNTVLTLNSTGHIIHGWGANFFHLPHMLTVDKKNNVWLTDVALHQVFKFGPYGGDSKKPLIVLGTPVRYLHSYLQGEPVTRLWVSLCGP